MSKPPPSTEEEKKFYSYLLINKAQRGGLTLLMLGTLPVIWFFISGSVFLNQSWLTIVIPVILACLPLAFYPMSETWIYRPWQSKPRKYERHYLD